MKQLELIPSRLRDTPRARLSRFIKSHAIVVEKTKEEFGLPWTAYYPSAGENHYFHEVGRTRRSAVRNICRAVGVKGCP